MTKTEKIKETCSCGATFEFEGADYSLAMRQQDFHNAHDTCRNGINVEKRIINDNPPAGVGFQVLEKEIGTVKNDAYYKHWSD